MILFVLIGILGLRVFGSPIRCAEGGPIEPLPPAPTGTTGDLSGLLIHQNGGELPGPNGRPASQRMTMASSTIAANRQFSCQQHDVDRNAARPSANKKNRASTTNCAVGMVIACSPHRCHRSRKDKSANRRHCHQTKNCSVRYHCRPHTIVVSSG